MSQRSNAPYAHPPNQSRTTRPLRIATSSRNLPIPIDYFPLHQIGAFTAEPVAADPQGVSFWISAGPEVRLDVLERLVAQPSVKAVRVTATKFSHSHDLGQYLSACASLRSRHGVSFEICLDLGGPKIRTCDLAMLGGRPSLDLLTNDPVSLVYRKDLPRLHGSSRFTDVKLLPVDAPLTSLGSLTLGSVLFVSDGWLQLRVEKVEEDAIHCRSLNDSPIVDGRGIDLPGMYDDCTGVSGRDEALITELGEFVRLIDYAAVSFVNDAATIRAYKSRFRHPVSSPRIVAKIETWRGIQNAEAIVGETDVLMIARGDLAVQLAPREVNMLAVEDRLRAVCRAAERPCVLATRVADSLEEGGEELDVFEKHRLLHEFRWGLPVTLMLANETASGKHALRNLAIVTRTSTELLARLAGVGAGGWEAH